MVQATACSVVDESHSPGRLARGMCRRHYRRFMKYGDPLGFAPKEALQPPGVCEIEGCEKTKRSRKARLCPMHYHREYRHGDVEAKPITIKTGTPRLYQSEYFPDHPLASKHGKVYVHRRVLFDSIGLGWHRCHWCQASIKWGRRGDANVLVVDHVNGNKGDNRLDNLVPCCLSCNSARAAAERRKVLQENGAWSVNDTIASLKVGRPVNAFYDKSKQGSESEVA